MAEVDVNMLNLSKAEAVKLIEQLKKIAGKKEPVKRTPDFIMPVDKERIHLKKADAVAKQRAFVEKQAKMKALEKEIDEKTSEDKPVSDTEDVEIKKRGRPKKID